MIGCVLPGVSEFLQCAVGLGGLRNQEVQLAVAEILLKCLVPPFPIKVPLFVGFGRMEFDIQGVGIRKVLDVHVVCLANASAFACNCSISLWRRIVKDRMEAVRPWVVLRALVRREARPLQGRRNRVSRYFSSEGAPRGLGLRKRPLQRRAQSACRSSFWAMERWVCPVPSGSMPSTGSGCWRTSSVSQMRLKIAPGQMSHHLAAPYRGHHGKGDLHCHPHVPRRPRGSQTLPDAPVSPWRFQGLVKPKVMRNRSDATSHTTSSRPRW